VKKFLAAALIPRKNSYEGQRRRGSPAKPTEAQSDDVKPQEDDVLVRYQYSTRSKKLFLYYTCNVSLKKISYTNCCPRTSVSCPRTITPCPRTFSSYPRTTANFPRTIFVRGQLSVVRCLPIWQDPILFTSDKTRGVKPVVFFWTGY
jgi:hypothetical protein